MTLLKPNWHYYHKQGLSSLFLMCALPLHFWTLLLAFRDVSWLTERTNAWDAIGVVSYGMVYAFVESILLFLVFSLLGFFISRSWNIEKRISLLSIFVLIISLWAIVPQLYFLWGEPIPEPIFQALVHNARPVRAMYMIAFAFCVTTFMTPAYFILQSDKGLKIAQNFIERITLLSIFYIFLSFIGLIIVIVRNI
ncbi:MAG: hypothetical protein H7Y59_06115 [Anaerolineales bacterium]|nr:hypothetical protein [Anaerolineales bacterium]